MQTQRLSLLGLVALCLVSSHAWAQASAGVSDERVNLPNAPGSISGVGENASVAGNHGAMAYSVKVEVPAGFEGVTPEIGLQYSSNSGSSVLGMGWTMDDFSIERMTSKGLQNYDTEDRFAADGSDELVRTAQGGSSATYRSRFESGFVRYTWLNRGTGEGGSWKAEYPDGRVGYYGADDSGTPVPSAQVVVPNSSPAKVFRWHLVAMVDRFGHKMQLSWTPDAGGVRLLDRIDYLFEAGQPRHSVRFVYEARQDIISNALPGFEMKLTQRLKEVRVYSASEVIRSYALTYEEDALSGGNSRLSRVARFGRGGVSYPVTFDFGYSQTLGGACTSDCQKPFMMDAGMVPADFGNGRAILLDINGDALPDVLAASQTGVHSFYYAHLDAEGRTSFSSTPVTSTKTVGSSPFILGDPAIQVLDVNGDGFVDLAAPKGPALLCNNGSGDWVGPAFCSSLPDGGAPSVPVDYNPVDDAADSAQQDPKYSRFFDYDNDKRIDWLQTATGGAATTVLHNTSAGFVSVPVENVGWVFDESTLQLADMNGDGLQDPVLVDATGSSGSINISYRLNYGHGHWGPIISVSVSGFGTSAAAMAELQDINGDTLADVVAVVDGEVRLALNRNGGRFDSAMTLTSASLGSGTIPARGTQTQVSFADMNGNGSSDIVWIQPNGAISYLELFPVRPNLLSRISNGIGAIQRISYGTSILEQARDILAGNPWLNRVPNPMTLVTSLQEFVTLTATDNGGAAEPTGLREVQRFRYHSGYYDGVEKQFRGYEGVERQMDSDMSRDAQEPGLKVESYDVGKTVTDFNGRLLKASTFGLGSGSQEALMEIRHEYALCPAAPATGTYFVCERATTTVITERDPSHAVTTRDEKDYDGYGQVIQERNLGVVNLGTPEAPKPCTPCTASGVFGDACGPQCMGDEAYTETDFIAPGTSASGNLWLVGKASETRSGAVAGTWSNFTRTYYDGPDFEGLALGQLTLGNPSRVERKLGANFETLSRTRYDAHGNAVEGIDALGTVADASKHRVVKTYEPAGLHVVSVEQRIGGADVDALRKTYITDTTWELVQESSSLYPVKGGTPLAPPQLTRYRYDEHGRTQKALQPGETDATAMFVVTYELADPASRMVVTTRAPASGGAPMVTAKCMDGRGREFQRRTQIDATSWFVSGFTEFDSHDKVVRAYDPYVSATGACDTQPPTGVPFHKTAYDALGRSTTVTAPDGDTTRTEYGPLVTRLFAESDTNPASPHFNTPTTQTTDGLGRVTSRSRLLVAGGQASTNTFTYDAQGNLATVRDAAGNLRTQSYDDFGRVVSVADTNAGSSTFEYDLQGNVTSSTDARGIVVKFEYDGLNRQVAQYAAATPDSTRRTSAYDYLAGCADCTNAGGKLVQTTWASSTGRGSVTRGYDIRGDLIQSAATLGGHTLITRWTYDDVGRLTAVTHPDGTTFSPTYDLAGRIVGMPGVVSSVTYDERGRPGSVAFANGTKTTITRDLRGRETLSKVTAADGSDLLHLAFTYGTDGFISSIDDGALAGRVRHGATNTYDAWGRLTSVTLPGADGSETLDYRFDAIDNITRITSSLGSSSRAHVGDLAYDQAHPNAAVSVGGDARNYDAAGRLTTRGADSFARDHLGLLAQASGEAGTASYEYDEAGLVAKSTPAGDVWYVTPSFEVRDGISASYAAVDGVEVMRAESDALAAQLLSDLAPASGNGPLTVMGDGTIDIADAWLAQGAAAGVLTLTKGPTPSEVAALLRSSARRLLMEDKTWLHHDQLGSVVLATNAQGILRGERSFYPTGLERASAGYVDARGFTGGEQDGSTGMIHFGARELDPRSGRWDRPDPKFGILSANNLSSDGEATTGYAYVANGFGTAVDPTGLGLVRKAFNSIKRTLNRIGRNISHSMLPGGAKRRELHQQHIARLVDEFVRHEGEHEFREGFKKDLDEHQGSVIDKVSEHTVRGGLTGDWHLGGKNLYAARFDSKYYANSGGKSPAAVENWNRKHDKFDAKIKKLENKYARKDLHENMFGNLHEINDRKEFVEMVYDGRATAEEVFHALVKRSGLELTYGRDVKF